MSFWAQIGLGLILGLVSAALVSGMVWVLVVTIPERRYRKERAAREKELDEYLKTPVSTLPFQTAMQSAMSALWSTGNAMWSSKNNGPEAFKGRGEVNSPVVGMRNWLITEDGHLTGMIKKNAVWTPGVNTAKCLRLDFGPNGGVYGQYGGFTGYYGHGLTAEDVTAMDEPDHGIDGCTHGLYAYYDGSRDFHQDGDVTGMIRSVGGEGHEGVIGARGFRVSHAEIVAIKFSHTVPDELRAKVLANYPDIPVFDDIVEMLTAVPTSADDLEYVPDPEDDFWTSRGWGDDE